MQKNFTQQDLKQIIADAYKEPVKNISFHTKIMMKNHEEIPVFNGCRIDRENDETVIMDEEDLKDFICADAHEKGYHVDSENGIKLNMRTRVFCYDSHSRRVISEFRGCSVEYQEKTFDVAAEETKFTSLADIRRQEHYDSLDKLSDRDLCEMIRAHFESHPTLPGEKALKEQVNYELCQINANIEAGTAKSDDALLSPETKQEFIHGYANTRIRETSVSLDGVPVNELNCRPLAEIPQEKTNSTVYVSRIEASLEKSENGTVYVMAENVDGKMANIGKLQDRFLTNNPMNVYGCKAELQISDFSNGKMKNLSAKVVVDTDLMSGDVVDLDNDMLSGLEQASGLEQ